MDLRILAMPTADAEAIRGESSDGFGNTPRVVIDRDGGSPCRHCLRRTTPGETVLLYSYRPFETPTPYQEIGPIFVHADACDRYDVRAGIPHDFDTRSVILRAYDAHDDIHGSQQYAEPRGALAVAEQMLADENVAYLHARSFARGCYLFRIERG